MNRDELIAAYDDLPPAPGDDFWDQKRREIRQRMLAEGPENFLTWSCIIATMFVADAPYVSAEADYLRHHTWRRWLNAISEDARIGNPQLLPGYEEPVTSGNMIHQAYHLARWEAHAKVHVPELKEIVEFGGGYGALALIARRAGFTGEYAIYDVPELRYLQAWYLGQARQVGIAFREWVPPSDSTDRVRSDLFIALWSLSETPQETQDMVLSGMESTYVLMALSDNHGAFAERVMANDRYTWTREPTALAGNSYLYGTRKEEPKAATTQRRRRT